MNIKKKKLIAREFLILLSCVGLTIVLYLGTFLYNFIQKTRLEKIGNQITLNEQKADSLQKPYNLKIEKQKWFFKENSERYNIEEAGFYNYSDLWILLSRIQRNDSIIYKWNNEWEADQKKVLKDINFESGQEFNKFIIANTPDLQDIENNRRSIIFTNKAKEFKDKYSETKYTVLSNSEQLSISLKLFLILLIIAFPVRFLIYAIKWSIITLKLEV